MEQWAAALRTPSMQRAHMQCSGPHTLGTQFIRNIIEESITVWYAHAKTRATLLKVRLGPTTRWRGCCRTYACTSRRREREYSGNFRDNSFRLVGDIQVSPTPPLSADNHTLTHGARAIHTVRALYTQPSCLPVPVGRHPGHCLLVTAPSAHPITSHHITSHHITSHHITSHHITSHHITSHHITSHHITSHHITSHHITSHHITSDHTTPHHTTPHRTAPHRIAPRHVTSHDMT